MGTFKTSMTGSEHGAIYEMVREAKEAPFLTNQFWDSHCDAPLCTNLRNLSSYEKNLAKYGQSFEKMVFLHICVFSWLSGWSHMLRPSVFTSVILRL